jgi:ferredoxin
MADKVKIAQDECMGCEACVETCPSVFGFAVLSGNLITSQKKMWGQVLKCHYPEP